MTPQQAVDEAPARRGSLPRGTCPGEASLGGMPVIGETSDRWTDCPLRVPGTGNPALSRSSPLGPSPKGNRGCGDGLRCAVANRRHLGNACCVGRQWAPERSEQARFGGLSDGKGCDSEWERQQWMRCDCSGRAKELNGTGSENGSCLVARRVFSFRRRGGGARACLTLRGQSTQSEAGQNSTNRTLALGWGAQELARGFTDSRPPCHHAESLDGKCQLPGQRSLAER